ncbi:TetR/AcrR family transcriptional regulator [Actimicrobium antarcticum]|uniref:TetR/AcrR family transcriptional regulator n=1 Tax=Actimicrobium antarcticum TaxID=1051899 RepID=A0ABP7STR6_9BURK
MAIKPVPPTSSPWSKKRDLDQEREVKRAAVLHTAAQLFNEKGFHATSLDQVAERLHITKPTLYYYIKNKDDILFQCVSRGLEMMQEAIRVAGLSGGSAHDKLVAAMRQYAEITTMDFGMCVIRVGEDPLPPESRKALRRIKGGIDREFRELIRQGIAEGSMIECDPRLAAFAIAGALSWIGRWYRPDGPESPTAIADQMIHLLTAGLSRKPVAANGSAVTKTTRATGKTPVVATRKKKAEPI